jgi:uncharacterized damage-inducible protein DinB
MDPMVMLDENELERLRYPVGRLRPKRELSTSDRAGLITEIAELPSRLAAAVHGLTAAQLDTPYRPGGWTLRQVVHHVADSHINSYVRFKLAVTEDEPAITTYDEAAWALLPDAQGDDVGVSLRLLDALHTRWVQFLRSLQPEEWQRAYRHPELGRVSLDVALQIYGWHSLHHTAHVTVTREREGW